MRIVSFGDYEWALAEAITDALASIGVEAEPVAGDLPSELPPMSVQVVSVGGQRPNVGVAAAGAMVHCRALTETDSRVLADHVAGVLTFLDSQQVSAHGANIAHIDQTNVPYPNPDPRNENFYRWSQQVTLTLKASLV